MIIINKIENKTSIHIGLFGHIDSGKTAIAARLSEIISTAGIDAHPQSKERGITIDLGFTSFFLENFLITLVDGPGHADLIKISASSIEIIDCAIIVIDINKGPQVQTGEHIIMIESLGIRDVIVILNKIDQFNRNIENEIKKIRKFFKSTSFGPNIPIYAVSAKKNQGFEKLRDGILDKVKDLKIQRDVNDPIIIPIDHHFSIKGRGAVITGTILKGKVKENQKLDIIPVNISGRVKSIQIFHHNVVSAQAGDRVGLNIKGLDVKKIYRGCYATNDAKEFEQSDLLEIEVHSNELFKKETHFGTQMHVTIGMYTAVGYIYPYYQFEGKKIQLESTTNKKTYKAFLWLNESVIISKNKSVLLLSRLDLPPTTLRILGSANLVNIPETPPLLYKFKVKKGIIQNPEHSQGVTCKGLAQSLEGARKIIGRNLEKPFTKIISPFGTKGAVIVGVDKSSFKSIKKGDPVILKELRSFILKSKKDLYFQN